MVTALPNVQLQNKVQEFISKAAQDAHQRQVGLSPPPAKPSQPGDPSTGEVLAEGCGRRSAKTLTAPSKPRALAFETGSWPRLTSSERGRMVWKLADLIEQHLQEFAELESLDNGKPLKSRTRRRRSRWPSTLFRYMAGWADENRGQHHSDLGSLHAGREVPGLHFAASR